MARSHAGSRPRGRAAVGQQTAVRRDLQQHDHWRHSSGLVPLLLLHLQELADDRRARARREASTSTATYIQQQPLLTCGACAPLLPSLQLPPRPWHRRLPRCLGVPRCCGAPLLALPRQALALPGQAQALQARALQQALQAQGLQTRVHPMATAAALLLLQQGMAAHCCAGLACSKDKLARETHCGKGAGWQGTVRKCRVLEARVVRAVARIWGRIGAGGTQRPQLCKQQVLPCATAACADMPAMPCPCLRCLRQEAHRRRRLA